jgi:UDP-N-acetyl-D-glucosamine dehydrogenase
MYTTKQGLVQKINDKQICVGIIGLGYVGLPLALSFAEVGIRVIGFDIDDTKVDLLNDGRSYFKHIEDTRIQYINNQGYFSATTNFARSKEMDALIICVPTPLNRHKEPDLSFIRQTVNSLLPHLRVGQMISLESTTYPGTTDEELKEVIESRGFVVGEDLFLVYSPEREDPANASYSTRTIPKVIGGVTPSCLDVGTALYQIAIEKVVPVSSTKAAELTKLLENIYRAVNIGLVNELKILADRMDVDIWEVIEAASTKPFGYSPFYPGPGLGGHCIPIDPFYLTWKAKEYGINTRFIELAGEINTLMPDWVVSKIVDALNERTKPLKGSKVLVLGLAYKKNVDDTRESPSIKLIDLLKEKGAEVSYSDPYIPLFPKVRNYSFNLKSVDINDAILSEFDCVLIATDHDAFDYEVIQKFSQLVVDTRGRYKGSYKNVVKC